ncbi:MAG: serine/threonine protein kinase [Pirellulaceae bacterium]|nr:MAG: serine/threonine protein kinase [Pirellulaceae bacterium]
MSARLLLDKLEELKLLDPSVVADLRRQLEQAARPIPAETLAKLLVDNGHLTKYQAAKLVEEVTAQREDRREARVASAEAKRSQAEAAEKKLAEDDELEQLIGGVVETPASPAGSRPQPSPSGTGSPPRSEPPAVKKPRTPGPQEAPDEKSSIQAKPVRQPAVPLDPWQVPDETPSHKTATEPLMAEPIDEQAEGLTDAAVSYAEPVAEPPLAEAGLPIETTSSSAVAAALRVPKKRAPRNPWESPLILVGGFALIVLAALSAVMWYSLTRGTAAEYFEAAEADYRDGAYANAVAKFDKFLRYFPNDPNASLARVRRQMAQLRMEAEGSRDPDQALQAAKHVLPQIENEPAFAEARAELATLLPDLAKAFAEKAKNARSAEEAKKLLEKVDEAMALVNNPVYLPTTLRKTQTNVIDRIEETVLQVRRDIEREERLTAVLASIDQAIEAGQPREALRQRDALVADYPGLARHPELIKRVMAIGQREREAVRGFTPQLTVRTEAPDIPVRRVVLYGRAGNGLPAGGSDYVLAVTVEGTVYGIEAGTGDVIWRRYVGNGNAFWPISLGSPNDPTPADWLLVDSDRWELMRVKGTTGEVVWAVAMGEPLHAPVLWRDRVLIATHSGRVYNVSLLDGTGSRAADFGQALPVGPQTNDRYTVFYQLGQQDHLYVMSVETMECQSVYYLGHRAEQVAIPPTLAVGMLFVATNSGSDFSFVHAFKLDATGQQLDPIAEPTRLDGHVISPPVVSGRRIYFATSLGAVVALEINPQEDPPISREIAPLPPVRREPLFTYMLADGNALFLADTRLVAYDVQASQAQFVRRWVTYEGQGFVGPLYQVGPALVSTRRSPQSGGFRISAVDTASGSKTFWQSDVGFPIAGLAIGPKDSLLAFTTNGSMYAIPRSGSTDRLAGTLDLRLGDASFEDVVPLGDGRVMFFSRAGRGLLYDPNEPEKQPQFVQFTLSAPAARVPPLLMADHLVVPLQSGEITALSPTGTGAKLLPFQPPLKPGSSVQWLPPVRIAEETDEFVIADDQQRLFRIGIIDTGGRRLTSLAQASLEENLVGRLAVLPKAILGVSSRSDADALWRFEIGSLRSSQPQTLPGRVVWGPFGFGDVALLALATASQQIELMAVNDNLQSQWTVPLPHGPPVGAVSLSDSELLLATAEGWLGRLQLSNGQMGGEVALTEPATGQPLVAGNSVWIPGSVGSLLQATLPDQKAE